VKNNINRRLKNFREYLNIKLYDSQKKSQKFLDRWSLFMVVAGLFTYLQYHGFPENEILDVFLVYSFDTLIGLQILKYFVGYVYTYQPKEYFSSTKIELFLVLLVLVHTTLSALGFNVLVWLELELNFSGDINHFNNYVEQLYFLVFLFIEISRVSARIPNIKLSPPKLLLISFFGLILLGAFLLTLPKMTVMNGSMPFFDALFTSISASCVTGLIVVDTATYFTVRGQFVIMLLIQLGGLNIISFATLFALMARRSVGIKYQSIIQDNFSIGSINESKTLIKKVFQFSFLIEIIGAVIIFFSWGDNVHFYNLRNKIFDSVFHAVSAFNNGGFSTFSNGLFETSIKHQNILQITIAFLIILGATGFTVLHEVVNLREIKEFWNKPWKKLSVNSRISLNTSIVLIILGTVAYLALEQNHTLQGMGIADQLTTAFFQSVTTRTAGFNTVDMSAISVPMVVFMLMLMYIGASPASTGGGIKTNTFTVLFMSAYSTMRGKKTIDIDKKTISFDSVNKALLIFLFSVSVIFVSVFALTITDGDKGILNLAFEEVSAFATVGLSRGITADLSTGGRIIIMISMFVGRVGLLTLGYALSKRLISSDYKYPKAKIIIG
jgi:potassium uptake TrkH family protein